MKSAVLNGHKAIKAGVCHDCGQPLLNTNGSFYERLEEVSMTSAYAAAICQSCWVATQGAPKCGARFAEDPELRCYLAPRHRGKCRYEVA